MVDDEAAYRSRTARLSSVDASSTTMISSGGRSCARRASSARERCWAWLKFGSMAESTASEPAEEDVGDDPGEAVVVKHATPRRNGRREANAIGYAV
jgi:hypothetical protein